MDALDQKLITLLRHNARRSISDLAIELGTARATVRSRMERLEAIGEIVGYTVILRSDTSALPVRGIMMIEVEGHKTERVLKALNGFSEISAVHTTHGQWDLVAELGAADLPGFDELLKRIRLVPGVAGSETTLYLTTPRSTRARL
jgi:DNA-binding Lrp family transcriptional regulator